MFSIFLRVVKKLHVRKRKPENHYWQKHFGSRQDVAQFSIEFHVPRENENRRNRSE
ncbi:hypothetical protein SDC9_208787 [bioreactor metagenome]|uniref:Uncharacterized protein n=1 Tax=bioreactor metagenome TaxID=1076179 RepID=A0A645JN76_9ZZZZ